MCGLVTEKKREVDVSLLSQVKRGKLKQPFLGLVYGVDGVGKSTLGADAPNPIFLGTEKGTSNLNVSRYPKEPKSFQDVFDAIEDIRANPHDFKTLVMDSLDWLEPLVWEHVIFKAGQAKITSIEDFGYGKGFMYAVDEWRKLISQLNRLRDERGLNILLIAHCHVKEAKDPTVTTDYNRYQLKLNDKAAALFREWVDAVLFANYETLVATDKKGKARTIGNEEESSPRFLFTERRPAFDAKNRHGLPFRLPLSWSDLAAAVEAGNPEDPQIVIASIQEMLPRVPNEEAKTKIAKYLQESGTDYVKLSNLETKVRTLLGAA